MNKIGVFICNYNKAKMVVKCVQSIFDQTMKDYDLFVIDNASTDDSVKRLTESYGDRITILENKDNLGGSGGFGRGIRTALEMNYEYFMLVDNDAFPDKNAIDHMYRYISSHGDVGICGAETLYLQNPDKIQDLGGKIDYENYKWGGILGGMKEITGSAVLECDYVASCFVIARTEAVREFGLFPEENFIYWDDIEWCTKCRLAGYKVVVISDAKVLHDMSGASKKNMFLKYYSNRNRLKYFTKYLQEESLDDFYLKFTEQFFLECYGAMHKGMTGTVMTFWNALDDFMHGITGKADGGKQVPYTEPEMKLERIAEKSERIYIYMPEHTGKDYNTLNSVLRKLTDANPDLEVKIGFSPDEKGNFDRVFQICGHVTEIEKNILPVIYADRYGNVVETQEDFWYFSSYSNALEGFRRMYRPLFENIVRELRK